MLRQGQLTHGAMKTEPDDLKVRDVLDLKSQQMLVVNSEYQRGVVWTRTQQKKLIDSVLRGYPIPLIYFHHIQQEAAGLRSERFEVIDGQQRITALHELDQRGHLNRMLRFWAQLERATAFSPSLAILDKVRAIR